MTYYGKSASKCPNHLAFKNAHNLAMAAPTSGTNASKIGVWSPQSTVYQERSLWPTTASFEP
ncbi:MAG: hypothetical protein RM338_03645 [Nostoc sp. DedQUE12a]|nr:hypothetical protein [Nostoc sp. DedQUE12a]